jgi:hypothetical protein
MSTTRRSLSLACGHFVLCAVLASAFSACSVGSGESSRSSEEAITSPAFDPPPDWLIHSTSGATVASSDPLNVILSSQSDTTIAAAWLPLLKPLGWSSVGIGTSALGLLEGKCIDPENASVETKGTYVEQSVSLRADGCANIADPGNPGGAKHNHARGWLQAETGAWFMAVSEEHVCAVDSFPFYDHCIDSNGFDQGREDLRTETLNEAKALGWQVMAEGVACPATVTAPGCVSFEYATRAAGTGSGGVAYDDQVLVVTLRLTSK